MSTPHNDRRSTSQPTQLELALSRQRVPDRNSERGGRSFYFFDFDDNVMSLETSIFIYDRETGAEVALSTRAFAEASAQLGRPGRFARFEIRPDDQTGSFRRFRDFSAAARGGRPQPFVEDLRATLADGEHRWRGPSWPLFDHAVFNGRPIAIVTARGHHPETLREGISLLVSAGHLGAAPNYLGIYTVSHPEVRRELGDVDGRRPVPELKKAAIEHAVDEAMRHYGESPFHRFGMSDDDPRNIDLILDAMRHLKRRYPENAFFVFDTSRHSVVRMEVSLHSTEASEVGGINQLQLFD